MNTSNYNHALMIEDCTQIFKIERDDMIHPFAKKWFQDMLDSTNIKQKQRR